MSSNRTPLPMAPNRLFGWLMEWMNGPSYRLAQKLLNAERGQHVLEIGFGTGKLLEMLARRTREIHLAGIEPTAAMLEAATGRRRLRRIGERLDMRLGAADDLPWEAKTFDSVAALHNFQFWEDPEQALSEIMRVLKPGGRLVLVLRDHSRNAPDWLPNPVSRSGREIDATVTLLSDCGFAAVEQAGKAGSSVALVALA